MCTYNKIPEIVDQNFTIAEDASNADVVGSVNVNDPNLLSLSYVILSGNDDGIFTIDSVTGEIIVSDNTNLDYESTQVYTLVIEVDNGISKSTADIVINISDIVEVVPVDRSRMGRSGKIRSTILRRPLYNCKNTLAINFSNKGTHREELCIYKNDYDLRLKEELQKIKGVCEINFNSYHNIHSQSKEIKKIQSFLKIQGLYDGKEDGIFGIKTHSGVKQFQLKYFNDILLP
ncbi:MAG TPA: hypothetical protein EYG72_03445 [Candidatus Pacebacteria bacterium]|nr:hypothetical protein [Candidatus Paceibacterota bacterium]